jgi:hypothetical protein
MKQFSTFLNAIEYHKSCVLCDSKMDINDRDLATDIGYEFRENKQKVSFFVFSNRDDTVTIDPETNEVEFSLKNIAGGIFYHGLTIDCKSCCQFSYVIQVRIDLSKRILLGTSLNSETLSIEDSEMVHEIKNIYATKKTEYTYFPKDGSSKRATFPLVSLNLINPKETIGRLRKLLIFS